MRRLVLTALLAFACGGDELPPPKSPAKKRPATSLQARRPAAGTLWRHEVIAVVDGGLGRFLRYLFARLEVAPILDDAERFVGWQIVRIYPEAFWEDVDLREGDVITAVNQLPIERETQAYEAFQSLKTADRLVIALVRQGEPLELVFRIAEQPGRRPASKPRRRPSADAGSSGRWPTRRM